MNRRTPADFHDESIRPDQHYSASRSGGLAEGERRLMIAILEDAMLCARNVIKQGGTGGDPDLEMAMAWFEDEDTDYIFSFESICEFLEIRSEDIRAQLERMRWVGRKGQRGHAPRERSRPAPAPPEYASNR